MLRRHRLIALSVFVCMLGACSSSASKAGPSSSTSAPAATTPGPSSSVPVPARCVPPATGPGGSVTKVSGVGSDWTLTSFDGAKIRLHWFRAPKATAAKPAPTVLMGPGWGESGDTNTLSAGLFGSVDLGSLLQAGYNVLTWDPRGFGQSTGTVEVDSAKYEARDVEKMLDWVSTQPGVLLDGPRDPRVGMAGGSYGGGIQFVTAAIDCRVDAITPLIAWHSLTTSLFKAETPKNGWSGLLYAATSGRSVDAHIKSAYNASIATGVIDPADQAFFASRGPADLIDRVNAPTLIVQGTVDNLFTLDEGITNYAILRGRGVPTAMVWFCGGHGVCLTNPGNLSQVGSAVMAWLNRYVKRDTSVSTGPRFAFVDQNGKRYTADDYPLPLAAPMQATGSGTLGLVPDGGSGPAHAAAGNQDPLAGVATAITPGRATNAADLTLTATAPAVVVGAPQLRLTYSGTAAAGPRPERVFAQLVDDTTGVVIGNQITPIAVTLDGKSHHLTVGLETIAFTFHPGAHVTLQLVATTVAYAQPRMGGTVTFQHIDLSLPVVRGLTAK